MGNLLFSPSGRIGPSEFMKGMIVIAVIGAVLSLLPLVSLSAGMIGGFAGILLLFPLFCLLIKRSHDAGRSGWMSIAWFVLLIVLSLIVGQIITMFFAGDVVADTTAALEAAGESGDLGAVMEMTGDLAKKTAIPSAIGSIIYTVAGAYIINMLNKQDMDENQYGPRPVDM